MKKITKLAVSVLLLLGINKQYSTKTNTKSTGSSNSRKSGKTCKKTNSQESNSDPDGSYTGVPVDGGKYAKPVQDADDL